MACSAGTTIGSVMAVCCHYIDQSLTRRHLLMALRTFIYLPLGDNQAYLVNIVLRDWGFNDLGSKLGSFMLDNSKESDVAVKALIPMLEPTAGDDMTCHLTDSLRLRCVGHMLCLVAGAALGCDDPTATADEWCNEWDPDQEQKVLDAWRKKGPVGKLKIVVHFIRCCRKHRKTFEQCGDDGEGLLDQPFGPLRLTGDRATRWNLTYDMIRRALNLRAEMETAQDTEETPPEDSQMWSDHQDHLIPSKDRLTPEDWAALADMLGVLDTLHSQLTHLQGQGVLLSSVLPSLLFLVDHLNNKLQKYGVDSSLRASVDAASRLQRDGRPFGHPADEMADDEVGHEEAQPAPEMDCDFGPHPAVLYTRRTLQKAAKKLAEYRMILEKTPAYVAAVVLDPRFNLAFFHERFCAEVAGRAMDLMRSSYEDYAKRYEPSLAVEPLAEALARQRQVVLDDFDRYLRPIDNVPRAHAISELNAYFRLGRLSDIADVLDWWKGQEAKFPVLYRMALDVFSMPLTVDECQRALDSADESIRHHHGEVTPSHLETTQLLKNWQDNNFP